MKKTKILAVSDIHGDEIFSKEIADIAKNEKIDLIILGGDMTTLDQQVENIIKPFDKLNKPILIIPGNHEPNSTINQFEQVYKNVKNLHGKHHIHKDIGFFGTGHADIFYTTDEKEIFENLKKGHSKIKHLKKKIMITHMHHFGSKSEIIGFQGSFSVRNAIEEFSPDILLSGHIHETGGLCEKIGGTTIFNIARTPIIFEI